MTIIIDLLAKPTAPENYHNRGAVAGLPLNWQDDTSGQLLAAVMEYLRQQPSPEQLKLVIAYLQYHIHAPVWLDEALMGTIEPAIVTEIEALRAQALAMTTLEEVNQYIFRALRAAIDPL